MHQTLEYDMRDNVRCGPTLCGSAKTRETARDSWYENDVKYKRTDALSVWHQQ